MHIIYVILYCIGCKAEQHSKVVWSCGKNWDEEWLNVTWKMLFLRSEEIGKDKIIYGNLESHKLSCEADESTVYTKEFEEGKEVHADEHHPNI